VGTNRAVGKGDQLRQHLLAVDGSGSHTDGVERSLGGTEAGPGIAEAHGDPEGRSALQGLAVRGGLDVELGRRHARGGDADELTIDIGRQRDGRDPSESSPVHAPNDDDAYRSVRRDARFFQPTTGC
jgi:hypothetical protein